jgi:predicted HNH restriction endonuclease
MKKERKNTPVSENKWRHSVVGRKQFATLQAPKEIVEYCAICDGLDRDVTLSMEDGTTYSFRAHFSSGGEMGLPKVYRDDVKNSGVVYVSIDDCPNDQSELPDLDEDFLEGGQTLRTHLVRERNPKLVKMAKDIRLQSSGELRCDVCGMLFEEQYGEIGKNYIEAHHLLPVSELSTSKRTQVKDLALLCSNCHRMIHKGNPFSIEELKSKLK